MGNLLSTVLSNRVLAIGIPFGVGTAIGMAMRDDVKTWYPTIKKPTWNPPNYLFGPVWSVLYTLMGLASYRIATSGGNVALPLGLYAGQLALNFAYSPLFFKKHDIKLAALDNTALVGVLGATIYEFHKIDPTASYMLLPYLAWGSFAAALTWKIHSLNAKPDDDSSSSLLDNVHGAASEATAKAANVFLKQSNEQQASDLDSTHP